MSKIVLIATNEEMYENAVFFRNSLENKESFDIYLAYMGEAVSLAKELSRKDVGVFICRGASAQMIINSGIDIPVIDMPLTDVDVMETLNQAKSLSDVEHPNIVFVGYSKTYSQIKAYLSAINTSVQHYDLEAEKDNRKIIEEIKDSVDVIVAGKSTAIIADEYGIKNVIMRSSIRSIELAYNMALSMRCAIAKEKKISEERNTIINSISEIIISINKERLITLFNTRAESSFKLESEEVVGKNIYSVIKSLKTDVIDDVFSTGSASTENIIVFNNKEYSLNLNPVLLEDDVEGIVISMQEIKEIQRIEAKVRQELYLKGNIARYGFEDIIFRSKELKKVVEIAKSFSKVDSNVLIFGETGTGKEMFAQSIHNSSSRKNGPFVAINCGAIPSGLVESELFGYVDGAFTGSRKGGKMGFFELAHEGTLFLDEISEMDISGQVILLRALQERQIRRVGGDAVIPVDVRVIAASNTQLYDLVKENKFRNDLFFRLCVLVLNIPPLRERREDIAAMSSYYVEKFNKVFNKNVFLTEDSMEVMKGFNWNGNVRQLKNFCERITVINSGEIIDRDYIEAEINNSYLFLNDKHYSNSNVLDNSDQIKKDAIIINNKVYYKKDLEMILKKNNENRTNTAKDIGVSRSTLWKYLKKLGI